MARDGDGLARDEGVARAEGLERGKAPAASDAPAPADLVAELEAIAARVEALAGDGRYFASVMRRSIDTLLRSADSGWFVYNAYWAIVGTHRGAGEVLAPEDAGLVRGWLAPLRPQVQALRPSRALDGALASFQHSRGITPDQPSGPAPAVRYG